MFWAELMVVLVMLIIGARYGGIFLGMSSGFAIAILVFGFGLSNCQTNCNGIEK